MWPHDQPAGGALPSPKGESSLQSRTTQVQRQEAFQFSMSVADVRVRRVRPHDQRARGTLPPPQGEPPLQSRPTQVLRQEALQVHQQQLRQHAVTSENVNTLTHTPQLQMYKSYDCFKP